MPAPAISCSPQDLVAAARCFRCIPPGLESSIITSLLCQWADNAASSFQPSDITGLVLWLDANAGVNVVPGVSFVWADQSASHNDFSGVGVLNFPNYNPASINGHPGIDFNGGFNEFLLGASPGPPFPFSIFVVAKIPVGLNSVNLLIACNGGAPAFYGSDPGVIGDSFLECYDGVGITTSNTDTYANNTPFLAELTNDGASPPNLYFNGAPLGLSASSNDNQDLTTANLIIGVTSSGVFSSPFTGAIGEIIIYNSVLTPAHRVQVEQYLNAKWNLGF